MRNTTPTTTPWHPASPGSGYRTEIEAIAGPARQGQVSGGAVLLVRVRMFDDPDLIDADTGQPAAQPDTFCDLDPTRPAGSPARCPPPPTLPNSFALTPDE